MANYILLITLLLVISSCSMLSSNRSFLSEMEHDDSRYYSPREDFPVTAGDTGRFWNSEKEQMARTPASVHDVAEERARYSLRQELKALEQQQGENASKMYSRHKHKFGSISEKIYFLNLPFSERENYLESRGFIGRAQYSGNMGGNTPYDRMYAARPTDIILGMSKNDVRLSWGNPVRVEIAGNPSYENERWVYNLDGATKYIYFEAGYVQGWE